MTAAEGTMLQSGYSFWYMRRTKNSGSGNNNNNNNNNTSKDNPSESAPTATDNAAPPPASSSSSSSSSTSTTSSANAGGGGGTVVHPYEESIKTIATIRTVEQFWSTYDWLVRPGDLPLTTDYHFFREGIKPTWEDPNNSRGGKWIVRLRKGLASRYWEEIVLALIGGQFVGSVPDGEVCGAVVSIRHGEDLVSVWNRTANDRDVADRLRESIKKILRLPSHVHMEYKPHQTSLQDRSSFRNTQVWKPRSVLERERSGGTMGGAGGGSTIGGSASGIGAAPSTGGLSGSSMDGEGVTGGRLRRSGSWGDRDELRGSKIKRDTERSWR